MMVCLEIRLMGGGMIRTGVLQRHLGEAPAVSIILAYRSEK